MTKKLNRIVIGALSIAMVAAAGMPAYAASADMGSGRFGGPSFSAAAPEKPADDIGRKSDAEAMAEGTIPENVPQHEEGQAEQRQNSDSQVSAAPEKPADDIGRKSDEEAMAEGTIPENVPQNAEVQNGQNQSSAQQQDNDQQAQKPEAGFDSTAIQNAVNALESETVKSAVQTKLDAYIAALNAEKTYLDSLSENSEMDTAYRNNVTSAREALEAALKEAGIDIKDLLPAAGARINRIGE